MRVSQRYQTRVGIWVRFTALVYGFGSGESQKPQTWFAVCFTGLYLVDPAVKIPLGCGQERLPDPEGKVSRRKGSRKGLINQIIHRLLINSIIN